MNLLQDLQKQAKERFDKLEVFYWNTDVGHEIAEPLSISPEDEAVVKKYVDSEIRIAVEAVVEEVKKTLIYE